MSPLLTEPQVPVQGRHSLAVGLDETLLRPDVTRQQVITSCEEAVRVGAAAVVVNPWWTSLAASTLRGTLVKVCVAIGFPLGSGHSTVKRFEASEALRVGAQELEMVINLGALKSGDRRAVQNDVASVVEPAHSGGALVKVVLETPLLNLEEKILSCELCLAAQADFVATSTGFFGDATVEDVSLLRGVMGDRAGVKACGGIHSLSSAIALQHAGASRLGIENAAPFLAELASSHSSH